MNSFRTWLRQPTTVAGVSALFATAAGAASGAMTWQQAVPLVVGGVVAMILPDNAGARTTIEHATADLIAVETAVIRPAAAQVSPAKTAG